MDRSDPNGCWRWTGWTTPQGYGRFDLGTLKVLATHLALIFTGQPRPPAPNHFALHGDTCVTTLCCNPAHLRWGSAKSNAGDRERLQRRKPAFGETHWQAKLDAEKVRYIRASPLNQYQLAAELGVSQVTIGNVRRGKVWRHVA